MDSSYFSLIKVNNNLKNTHRSTYKVHYLSFYIVPLLISIYLVYFTYIILLVPKDPRLIGKDRFIWKKESFIFLYNNHSLGKKSEVIQEKAHSMGTTFSRSPDHS